MQIIAFYTTKYFSPHLNWFRNSMCIPTTVSPLRQLLFRISLNYNRFQNRFGGRPWASNVNETVIVGALPITSRFLGIAKNEKITGILSVVEPFELKHKEVISEDYLIENNIEQLCLSVQDFTGLPTRKQLLCGLDFIKKHSQTSGKVYVHCKAGRTRSVVVAICYLIRDCHMSVEKSVGLIQQSRPHIRIFDKHLQYINAFYSDFNTR